MCWIMKSTRITIQSALWNLKMPWILYRSLLPWGSGTLIPVDHLFEAPILPSCLSTCSKRKIIFAWFLSSKLKGTELVENITWATTCLLTNLWWSGDRYSWSDSARNCHPTPTSSRHVNISTSIHSSSNKSSTLLVYLGCTTSVHHIFLHSLIRYISNFYQWRIKKAERAQNDLSSRHSETRKARVSREDNSYSFKSLKIHQRSSYVKRERNNLTISITFHLTLSQSKRNYSERSHNRLKYSDVEHSYAFIC